MFLFSFATRTDNGKRFSCSATGVAESNEIVLSVLCMFNNMTLTSPVNQFV